MSREMKDSGIPWIGEIPEGWNCARMKQIGKYVNGYAFKPEDWGNSGKPIIRIQDLTGSNNSPNYYEGDIDEKYLIKNGDILVSWAATLDAFIWGNGEGWLNQHIFKAIPNTSIQKDFFFWLLKVAMSHMNNDNKHGIVMQHLTLNVFGNFIIPLPPLPEQQSIASFLDRKCSEIDKLIALQEQIVEELNAYKQSVITEAVTKGLNPYVPMKDSGIEWIGEIPKEWHTCQVKNIFTIARGRVIPITEMDDSYHYPVYSSQTKDNGCMGYIPTFDYEGEALTWTTDGANAGTVFYRVGKFNCTNICGVLQLKTRTSFITYMLYSVGHSAFHCRRADTNGYKIMSNEMAEIKIAVPPLVEQHRIAEFLDRKCSEIDKLIAIKQSKIDSLNEYKKSIIYEYVTGKKEIE